MGIYYGNTGMVELEIRGRVAVVTMVAGENRLNLGMCAALLKILDKVEHETDALSLVVRSAHERVWCYGFDTDWVKQIQSEGDAASLKEFLIRDLELRRRLLLYPLITIAAINGHVFGGGAILSCCFDFRFMRSDRGFFCIPAVDLGYPVVSGTAALLKQVLPPHMFVDAMLTGRRFTGEEVESAYVVKAAYTNDVLMDKVMEFALNLNKDRGTIAKMKEVSNRHIIHLLDTEDLQTVQAGIFRV